MAYGTLLADVIQSSTSGTAPQFNDGGGTQIGTLCRAWVSFAGATGTIRASYNISSVTRNGTGDFSINLSSALSDANYSGVVTCGSGSTSVGFGGSYTAVPTASVYRIVTSSTSAATDYAYTMCAIFR